MSYPYSEVFTSSPATTNANYPSDTGINLGGEGGHISVAGTFNGATVTLQLQDYFNNWIPEQNGVWTTSEGRDFHIPRGKNVRINITNSGGSTSIQVAMDYFKFRPGSA